MARNARNGWAKRRDARRHTRSRWGRTRLIAAMIVLALGTATVALSLSRGTTDAGFGMLKGRWVRPDGGYVLEIRDIDASGAIDASYLNPRPIRVTRAEATRGGSSPTVFIELNAPGYPGSTYSLTYDRQRDQLSGVYFQAALQQQFDVAFARTR